MVDFNRFLRIHSVEITEIYSQNFGKNFVKVTDLLKNLLNSYIVRVNLSFFHSAHCHSVIISTFYCHMKNFP